MIAQAVAKNFNHLPFKLRSEIMGVGPKRRLVRSQRQA
jgi:hypothetical protein